MPERSDRDTSLPIASDCDAAHPPAFPILVNISKGFPSSHTFMVTYRFPHHVPTLCVVPRVISGLGRGTIFSNPLFFAFCSFFFVSPVLNTCSSLLPSL